MLAAVKVWARRIKLDIVALFLAARDPRTPWHAKALAAFVAAYALSPIDIIPDFIPILGYLDDLLLVPAGIWLAVRLVPVDLMDEFRRKAADIGKQPKSRVGALLIIAIWIAAAGGLSWWFWPRQAG